MVRLALTILSAILLFTTLAQAAPCSKRNAESTSHDVDFSPEPSTGMLQSPVQNDDMDQADDSPVSMNDDTLPYNAYEDGEVPVDDSEMEEFEYEDTSGGLVRVGDITLDRTADNIGLRHLVDLTL